ncbi:ABC transporter substrate-binding protein [Streptomyces sp. NPDC007264]|uniref:ABC transporter substrate-binding protein n=1 Tax=Streptomyces sp. NPDC007264 TaxID=3364777 RepID=UPI0036DEA9F1
MAGRLWRWLREDVWEIPFRRYAALLLAAVLTAAAVWGGLRLGEQDRSCAEGVVRPGDSDDCVGVSATAYDFGQPRFTRVIRAVDRENDRLTAGRYVTVALFEPFTASDPDSVNDTLHELQGAYLAQYHANHEATGETPDIRLVLANTGRDGTYWPDVVDRLTEMAEGPDRLRAVTGIGLSTDNNRAAVRELTGRGIPVVGSSITADSLANGPGGKDPFPGLARVAPTNSDSARALASFARVSAGRAMLVYDRPGDPYTRTLQSAFERLTAGSPYQPQPFSPPADRTQEGTTANQFRQITQLVCDTPKTTDTILFAGRHTQLRQFVNALGARGCMDHRLTLLTGDEGSYLTGDRQLDRTALNRSLSVRYTALAHPDAWKGEKATTGGSPADAAALDSLIGRSGREPVGPIGPVVLDDGQLIIAYDAMRLVVQGVREATPSGRVAPALGDVVNEWSLMKGSQRLNGASGWICLDAHGNPYDKAVPIVELTPSGGSRFVRIAWPEGKAPARECLPPA